MKTSKKKSLKKINKSLVARYEIRTGYRKKIVDFGKKFTDIIVIDTFTGQNFAWSIKNAMKAMNLKKTKPEIVLPYLINQLLIQIQETDFDKIKKKSK